MDDTDDSNLQAFVQPAQLDGSAFPSTSAFPFSSDSSSLSSFSSAAPAYFDNTRVSPRFRTHSIASSIASAAESVQSFESSFFGDTPGTSAGARPSFEQPPASLVPAVDGFTVVSPEGRVQQDPGAFPPPPGTSSGISVLRDNLNSLGLRGTDADDQPFLYQPPSSLHEPPLDPALYAPIPPPTGSRRRAPPDPIRTGSYVSDLQRAFVPQGTAVPLIPDTPALPVPVDPYAAVEPLSTHLPPPLPASDYQLPLDTAETDSLPDPFSDLPPLPVPPFPATSSDAPLALRPASLAAARHLRNTSSPYARRPSHARTVSYSSVASASSGHQFDGGRTRSGTVSSRSSSVDLGAGNDFSSDYEPSGDEGGAAGRRYSTTSRRSSNAAMVAARRTLKPLNREVETYVWHPQRGQLSRVPNGVQPEEMLQAAGEDEAELLTFGAGSYYKVWDEDDLEILPCDSRSRVNTWLRGQNCVEGCPFRFEAKRPSVIRQHVVSCKSRKVRIGSHDPLKRLCQLQLDAQTLESNLRNVQAANNRNGHQRRLSNLPPHPPPSATFTAASAEDDRRSLSSVGSRHSRGSSYFASGSTREHVATSETHWQGQSNSGYSPASQAPSSASSGGFSTPAYEYTHDALSGFAAPTAPFSSAPVDAVSSVGEDNWLANYGLTVPTGGAGSSSAASFFDPTAVPSSFSQTTDSFLSFDE
ncbi:hypothetical protein JCM8097_007068 [Rhodosporidiobolus ruineniae]